jgi:hypothetical protein
LKRFYEKLSVSIFLDCWGFVLAVRACGCYNRAPNLFLEIKDGLLARAGAD